MLIEAINAAIKTHQAQLAQATTGINAAIMNANRAPFTELAQIMAKAYRPWFTELGDLARGLYATPLTDAMLAQVGEFVTELASSEFQDVAPAQDAGRRGLQKLGDREVAAMMTVAMFLLVYISFGLAIKHNAQLAELAATKGPTPFEAAMAAGAFTFWVWMTYSRRDS